MSEYNKLKEKFDQDIKELQENCPHEKLSEPVEVYWAIGHSSGIVLGSVNAAVNRWMITRGRKE